MPTHFNYRYRIVTNAGEYNTSTGEEPMEDKGIENWIKENQQAISTRFGTAPGTEPVKLTAIYSLKSNNTEVKIWG
jgi:hypothetical protein